MPVTSDTRPVAVVIGGAGGIGAACCRRFAQAGWSVAVGDVDEAAAQRLADELGGRGWSIDLAAPEAIETFAAQVDATQGPVAALVNSAAWFHDAKPPETLSLADWDRTFSICLRGPYLASVAFGLAMARRGRGAIVNIASTAGMRSAPLHAYAPAKAALLNMTECLAAEFGRSGVRVNAVTPSLTRTPALERSIARRERFLPDVERFTALGRFVEPSEVAEAVYFLASDEASAITGANIPVDAGSLLSPSWQMFGGLRQPE